MKFGCRGWKRKVRTHCKQGHAIEGDNLYIRPSDKARFCKVCKKAKYIPRLRTNLCKNGHELTPSNTYTHGKRQHRRCKICSLAYDKDWKVNNPEKAKRIIQDASRKKLYGMSSEEYDALVLKQDGKCAICGRDADPLNIDHDHRTSKIRGGLCRTCNVGIGALGDCPEMLDRAARYIRENS